VASVLALARRLRDETELTIRAAKGTAAAWRRATADWRRDLVSALPIRAPIPPNPAHQRHIVLVAGCSAAVAAGVAVIVFVAVLGAPEPPRPATVDRVGTGGVEPGGAVAATPSPSTSARGSATGRPDQAKSTRRTPGWSNFSPTPMRPPWPPTASASAATPADASELGSGAPGTPQPAVSTTQGPAPSGTATPTSPVSPSPIVTGGTSTPTRKSL
jgi:hypothetical protein